MDAILGIMGLIGAVLAALTGYAYTEGMKGKMGIGDKIAIVIMFGAAIAAAVDAFKVMASTIK